MLDIVRSKGGVGYVISEKFPSMNFVETTYSFWILLNTNQHRFQERLDAGSVKTRLFASSKQCELSRWFISGW
jgi:hypothetical protein